MTDAETAALIGLDWGTTSLRAYCIGATGAVLDSIASPAGILADHPEGFAATFRQVTASWRERYRPLPVVASGMITSRNGWVETPYVEAPAGLDEFAQDLVTVEAEDAGIVHFVKGLSCRDSAGVPDIMRGEEVQILGALETIGPQDGAGMLFLLPGTHSKWAAVRDGRINGFETYMTGEVFSVLLRHSILGKLAASKAAAPGAAFAKAVEMGLSGETSILHKMFSARTLPLFDRLPPEEIAAHLSGLLIGEEIAAALRQAGPAETPRVVIAGRGDLAEAYATALQIAGVLSSFAPEHVAARGHHALARAGGILP